MPHPHETIEDISELSAEITSPQTPKNIRRHLVDNYAQYIRWAYERAEPIHMRFLNFITNHPDATFGDVENELSDLHMDDGELQVVWSVYSEFHHRREAVVQVNTYIDHMARNIFGSTHEKPKSDEDQMVTDAKSLLFAEALTHREPEGNVEMVQFPFAVGLHFFGNKDIKIVEGGKDVIAEYKDSQTITGTKDGFPLIVLGPKANEQSITHEETHGLNAAIFAGLLHEGISDNLWGKDPREETTIQEILEDISTKSNEEIIAAVEALMPLILSNAKDEVIAFFSATENFTSALTILWQSRIKKKTHVLEDTTAYDYFNSIGLKPKMFKKGNEHLLYNQLVDSFNAALKRNVGFLRLLWGMSLYEGKNRIQKEQLLSFMRFTPISLWQQTGRHVFADQYRELNKIRPHMEQQMAMWNTRATELERDYYTRIRLPNSMTYDTYRSESRQGNGDDIGKISDEGELVCKQIDEIILQIEDSIVSIKDGSMRHDLFNPKSLEKIESITQKQLIDLSHLMTELFVHYQKTLIIRYSVTFRI